MKDKIKSYVLRTGRMSKSQKKAYESLFDTYCLPFKEELIDFKSIFDFKNIILEIGFGMGLATAQIADENPHNGYLGIEVHQAGIGKLLSEIDRLRLDNVRIVRHDAVEVIESMIPDLSLSGIHIFFPDPWPKNKHHKRRLIQEEFISGAVQKLKEDGYIYIVTDWEDYAYSILKVLNKTKNIFNPCKTFAEKQDWRPETRYEKKGKNKSHNIYEIKYYKRT